MSRTIKYIIGITASVLVMLYSAYATLYFGWVTATPLSPAQLKRAQFDCGAWLTMTVICFVTALILSVLFYRHYKSTRMKLRQPNQALLPTPMSVTTPAAQDSRQP